ncbi:MAG: aminotransferase class III-fold pyridoxal phosphate-dependent enzyme [Myxococcota bacterium]
MSQSFSPTAMYAGSTTSQDWRRMPKYVGHLLETLGSGRVPLTIHSGEGALLFDANGKEYWDFYGGHAVTLLGQGHPKLVEAIATQARQLTFMTTLADVPVRTKAAHALCAFTGMPVAWFVNSGAEANEAALKIARKVTGRPVVIAMEHGFHGRTMGALGVTWGYRDQHAPAHGEVRFVPFGDLAALEAALDERVAAVITEPVQGIAGIVEPPAGWLAAVHERVHANGSVLICDEVQSGIGRAGHPLLSKVMGVDADLVTVGKGVGGGFPVAALLLSAELASTVKPGEHGTTFGGGPLACAAVSATLEAIVEEGLLDKAKALEQALKARLGAIRGVEQVRGAGVWIGVVLDRPAKPVAAALLERRFLVGTASDPAVLRLCPPAVTPLYAVEALGAALAEVLA